MENVNREKYWFNFRIRGTWGAGPIGRAKQRGWVGIMFKNFSKRGGGGVKICALS